MTTKKISIADKLCSLMFCQNKLKKNKCFHPQPIVFVNIWSIQTTKHSIGVMLLKLCRILDHQRVMGGCWTGNFSYYCLSQKAPAPVSLLKLMTCKISANQQNCSCSNTGLACTEVCFRMADDEACSNRHGLTSISDSEENNEESSFERNCKIANI